MKVTAIIPAYEPDEKLAETAKALIEAGFDSIVVIDDGSSREKREYFDAAEKLPGCVLLRHEINRGKGAALKTAFKWFLENRPEDIGVVTLDSDGQHRACDVKACALALENAPGSLILGSRDFSLPQVPPKSRIGNRTTAAVMTYCCGVKVSDTQTGLRAIPADFVKRLLGVAGERYEYEINMLLETKEAGIPIEEVRIETVYYDNNENTHFRPVLDSWRIYKPILKFFSSSLVCSLVDILLFMLLNLLFAEQPSETRLLIATAGARVMSSMLNFMVNKKVVFRGRNGLSASIWRYYTLAALQMLASWGGVYALSHLLPMPDTFSKIITDTILFMVSFKIQQRWVFKG